MVEFYVERSAQSRSRRTGHASELFRSRRLRELGGCAFANRIRMGARRRQDRHRWKFRRERTLSSDVAQAITARSSSRANVRRRLGMDAQLLLAVSRLSR